MSGYEKFTDGRDFTLRVTPKASRNALDLGQDGVSDLRVWVTVVPEDGKANKAVVKLLAKALGVAKTRLELVRGASGRDKVFRVNPR